MQAIRLSIVAASSSLRYIWVCVFKAQHTCNDYLHFKYSTHTISTKTTFDIKLQHNVNAYRTRTKCKHGLHQYSNDSKA